MTQQEIDDQAKKFAEELGKVLNATGAGGTGKSAKDKAMEKAVDTVAKLNQAMKKSTKSVDEWEKRLADSASSLEDARDSLERTGGDVNTLSQATKDLEADFAKFNSAKRLDTLGRGTVTLGLTMGQAGAKFATGLAATLSQTESEFGAASSMMSVGLGAVSAVAATGAKTVGAFLSLIPVVGDGLSKIADVAAAAAEKLGQLGQTVIPILTGEMEKYIRSFDGMNKAGAIFTNGLTGMLEATAKADMPLSVFSKGLVAGAENLAKAGTTSGAGAMRIAQAFNSGDKMLKQKLRSLGIGYDEQVEMLAQVAADARSVNNRLIDNPTKLAQETESYARNLRVLSAITGQDAKSKMEEARRVSSQFQFRNEAARMGVNIGNVNAVLGQLPKEMQVGIQQLFGSGAISDMETNKMMALVPGFKDSIDAVVNAMKSGQLNSEAGTNDLLKTLAGQREQMKAVNDSGSNAAIGIAALHGKVSGLGDAMQRTTDYTLLAGKAETLAAIEAAKKQAEDPQVKALVGASKASMDLATTMEQLVSKSGAVTKFADAMTYTAELTRKAVGEFYDLLDKSKNGGSSPTPTSMAKAEVKSARATPNAVTDAEGARNVLANGSPRDIAALGGRAKLEALAGQPALGGAVAMPKPTGIAAPSQPSPEFQKILSDTVQSMKAGQVALATGDNKAMADALAAQNALLARQAELTQQMVDKMTEANKTNKNILAVTR